jgi:hypothetical protein
VTRFVACLISCFMIFPLSADMDSIPPTLFWAVTLFA